MITSIATVLKGLSTYISEGGEIDPSRIPGLNGGKSKILEYADELTVEPTIILSADLKNKPEASNAIDAAIDSFTLNYEKAIEVLVKVYGVKANVALKLISKTKPYSEDVVTVFGLESLDAESFDLEAKPTENLVATRELNLQIQTTGDTVVKINMHVRASIKYVSTDEFVSVAETDGADKTFFNRIDDLRAGMISWSDFLFATDLVEKYERNRIKSASDLAKEINSAKVGNIDNKSDSRYNIYIISDTVQRRIEAAAKARFSKDRKRDQLMTMYLAFSFIILDEDYERAIFYYDGKKSSVDIPYSKLTKSKSNETLEILKLALQGR
jgi:hypothetical protein